MSRQRFLALLIAALVAISGALYLNARRDRQPEAQGSLLLPTLAGDMNSITAVTLRKGSATPAVTVHETGRQWSVAERGDYPADVDKLRRLMTALRDARIVEEKTSDPARYATIGVEDPSQPGASAEITVIGPHGKQAVIVGKPVGEGSFVRRAGEKQSYSVEPAIIVDAQPQDWIESRVLDVAGTLIQSVEVKPAAGAAYTVRRLHPTDASFSLEGVPAGRKALDAPALAPSPTLLAGLDAEDVSNAAAIDFSQSSQAIVTLTDGNVITLTGAVIGDKHWIRAAASKDAALTAKAEGRAFQVASYRYEAIFKPLEQLLVPKPTPAPKPTPVPKDGKEPKH